MFKLKSSLRDPEPGQAGEGVTQSPQAQNPAVPAVDLQAEINKALQAQQAEFAAQLEQATGHKDIKSLTDAQLKAQGKLQELADAKAAEAQGYKAKYEQLAIDNALLSASAEAVDPAIVKDLLAGKAQVDDNGSVSIDGKPVVDAVKKLLEDKPFLAKAQGGTGSGAPQTAAPAVNNPWSKEHFNLTEQIRLSKENPTLAAQLKAAAGR